jgi:hypothetical protein
VASKAFCVYAEAMIMMMMMILSANLRHTFEVGNRARRTVQEVFARQTAFGAKADLQTPSPKRIPSERYLARGVDKEDVAAA